MFVDPVNIFFSRFIFGSVALILTLIAADVVQNLVHKIRRQKHEDALKDGLTSFLYDQINKKKDGSE